MKRHTTNRGSRRRGVTLIETVLSLLILGGAFVALMNTVASARASHGVAAQRQLGMVLAEDMMAEILSKEKYKEGNSIGPDSGEETGNRSLFDDIDDFHAWSATSPVNADGSAIAGAQGYTRTVTVVWAKPNNPNVVRSNDSGVKKIVVKVKRGTNVVAELVALRTETWVKPEESY